MNIFMKKVCRKCASKADPFLISIKVQNSQYMPETLENEIFWLSKTLKKLTWFFSLHPFSFYGQDYEKQKGPVTSYQSHFGSQITFLKIPSFSGLGYFHDLMQSGFRVIPRITFSNLWKPIDNIIVIPVSSDPSNLGTVERKWKKLQKNEYLKNEESF